VKYPVFALLGIGLVGSGCFNPHIKEGGFACSGAQDGQCPTGYFCINKICVSNPNAAPGPGVGGGGGVTVDMSIAPDLAMSPQMSMPDLSRPGVAVDMARPVVVADMARPPADMAKPVNTCSHGICKTGAALDPTCDPCVNTVCNSDATCCDSTFGLWDSICVGEAKKCTPLPPGC
jgi:hypothetical protein